MNEWLSLLVDLRGGLDPPGVGQWVKKILHPTSIMLSLNVCLFVLQFKVNC